MVEQRYRWDFIGLSTDEKPTASTSPKVTDGSTFYCSDTSKLYVWYKNQWYEKTATGGGGGAGVAYVDLTPTNITSSTITVTSSKTPTEVKAMVDAGTPVIYRLVITESVGGFVAGSYLLQTVMSSDVGIMASAIAMNGQYPQSYVYVHHANVASGTIYISTIGGSFN